MEDRKTVGCQLFIQATDELEAEIERELAEQKEANAAAVATIKELINENKNRGNGEGYAD